MLSSFWLDRRARFAEIDPEGSMTADYHPNGWHGPGSNRWQLTGPIAAEAAFKPAAAACAVALGHREAIDAWSGWLDEVRRLVPYRSRRSLDCRLNLELIQFEMISDVSAELCTLLADEALYRNLLVEGRNGPSVIGPAGADDRDRIERRRAFVRPLLDRKGWSPRRWAERAGVDPSVAYGFLNGANPRPDNRRALAEELGQADLPD